MSAPIPKDPLDDLITLFVAAVNHFLDREVFKVDPPERPRVQNLPDLMRVWEEFKRHISRMHQVWVGAEPKVKERLQKIVLLGSEVIAQSDDPYIVGPVDDLVRMASEEQAEIGNVIERLGQATSFPTVLQLIPELGGFGSRTAERRNSISAVLDSLTAYYVLQLPPRDPA